VWLVALACWTTVLRSPRALAVGSVVALALLFASPVTAFVHGEYAVGGAEFNAMSPLLDALRASQEGMLTHGEIFRLGGLCAISLIVATIAVTSRRPIRQNFDIYPTSTHPIVAS
jgi:hypothetical protein